MEEVKVEIVDVHQILYNNSRAETIPERIIIKLEPLDENTGMSSSDHEMEPESPRTTQRDVDGSEEFFGQLIVKAEPFDMPSQDDDVGEPRKSDGRPPKVDTGVKRTFTYKGGSRSQFDEFFSYQCDQCKDKDGHSLPMPGYFQFRQHLKTVHKSDTTPYAYCCGRKLYPFNFFNHVRKHHAPEDGEINCPECDLICANKAALAVHKAEDHIPTEFACSECDQKIATLKEWTKHKEVCHKDTAPCPVCGKDILIKHLERHRRSHTSGQFECVLCNKSFRTQLMLTQHEAKHTSEHKATLKLKVIEKLDYDEYFTYHCESCPEVDGKPKVLSNYQEMKAHFKSEHKRKGYAFCCGVKFFYDRMRGHLLRHLHPEKEFKCDQCYKSFDSEVALKMHIYNTKNSTRHSTSTRTVCDGRHRCLKCKMTFASIKDLSSHTNLSPEHNPTIICELCGKSMKEKSLKMHMASRHFQEKTACTECGKVFSNKNNAYAHYLVMHKNRDKLRSCNFCDFKSPHQSTVSSHSQKEHGKYADGTAYVRPSFKCAICEKNFKCKKYLKDHMTIHTGKKNYSCEFCKAKFRVATAYYKHRRKEHPAEYATRKAESKGIKKVGNLS